MVSATHLQIITGSWGGNQCTGYQCFTARPFSVSWCCFITTCIVVWTEKMASLWLRLIARGNSLNCRRYMRVISSNPCFFPPFCPTQMHSQNLKKLETQGTDLCYCLLLLKQEVKEKIGGEKKEKKYGSW